MSNHKTEYTHRVMSETPTKFWINNPTLQEAKQAIAAGAVCATTNPTYLQRLLKEEHEYVQSLVEKSLEKTNDNNVVADKVIQNAISRIQKLFYLIYKSTKGREGYVAIQGDPRVNNDSDAIIESALQYRQIGENIIIKVPATPAGAYALKQLIKSGIPVIATLGFSVAQAVFMAEAYREALKQTKTSPVCYITFIAGILDTYLSEKAEREGIIIGKELIQQAGCSATRVAYKIFKERKYKAVLLGGGARGAHHFTELVGGDIAITIGWNLAHQLIEDNSIVVSRIDAKISKHVLSELEEKLPDFRKAYYEKALLPEEFREFGPVVSFQNSFLAGYSQLLDFITLCRASVQNNKGGI